MRRVLQAWRWYGPDDPIPLSHIRQSGASSVVTSLHQIDIGEIWTVDEIMIRKELIESNGLSWDVVESLPVHDDIKRGLGDYELYIKNYKESIFNLSSCGVTTITYNFMPILDWTRTDLNSQLDDGSTALAFDISAIALFDIYVLKRTGALESYPAEIIDEARKLYENWSQSDLDHLTQNIIAGLPGSTSKNIDSLNEFTDLFTSYRHIGHNELRSNLKFFLNEVIPIAEECGIHLALHPDDPPFSLFGLPRIVCSEEDLDFVLGCVDSVNNGLCFCTGSLGVNPKNELGSMIAKYGERIHFFHLRSVQHVGYKKFFEADHLAGDVNMAEVMRGIVLLQQTRDKRIPMRPDHGHRMLDDLGKKVNPGYSAIGRLRGLAELRGLEEGIIHTMNR